MGTLSRRTPGSNTTLFQMSLLPLSTLTSMFSKWRGRGDDREGGGGEDRGRGRGREGQGVGEGRTGGGGRGGGGENRERGGEDRTRKGSERVIREGEDVTSVEIIVTMHFSPPHLPLPPPSPPRWTGSNTNPNNNDGQGRAGTDRSNIVLLGMMNFDEGNGMAVANSPKNGHWGNSHPSHLDHNQTFLGWSRGDRQTVAVLDNGKLWNKYRVSIQTGKPSTAIGLYSGHYSTFSW